MKWWYSPFELRPLKKLNNRSSLAPRSGLYLKNSNGGVTEYVPWPEFGDQTVEGFLKNPDQQLWENLQRLAELPLLPKPKPFLNHYLLTPSDQLLADRQVVKIKLNKDYDEAIEMMEEAPVNTCRIDFNQALNLEEFITFLNSISVELKQKIEYIEDPFKYDQGLWKEDYGVPLALDLAGDDEHFPLRVYKPMVQRRPRGAKKIIFSSYMGSWLGMWQTYLKLLDEGDLNLYHGIVTPGLYQDEMIPFVPAEGDYFSPDLELVKIELERLLAREWIAWK